MPQADWTRPVNSTSLGLRYRFPVCLGSCSFHTSSVSASTTRTNFVSLSSVALSGGDVVVSVPAGAGSGTVYLMALTPSVQVPIAQGENAGAHITYHNVARQLTMLGDWKGGAVSFKSPRGSAKDIGQFLAIVQRDMARPVVGLGALTVS